MPQLLNFYNEHRTLTNDTNLVSHQQLRRLTEKQRKALKCAEQLSSVLNDLDAIFFEGSSIDAKEESPVVSYGYGITCAVITFGSSYMNPKEQYVIRFYNDCTGTCGSNPANTTGCSTKDRNRLQHDISRMCTRELIHGMNDITFSSSATLDSQQPRQNDGDQGADNNNMSTFTKIDKSAWSSKVSIALLCRKDILYMMHELNQQQNQQKTLDKPSSEPNASLSSSVSNMNNSGGGRTSFTILPTYELRTPRMLPKCKSNKNKNRHRPFLVLDVIGPTSSKCTAQQKSPRMEAADDYSWISLRSSMKGYRS